MIATLAELTAALKGATGGEIFDLGTSEIGALNLSRIKPAGPVTIRGGHFTSANISGCANLTFEGFALDFAPGEETVANTPVFRIYGSQDIILQDARLTGGPAIAGIPIDAPLSAKMDSNSVIGLPVGKGITFDRCERMAFRRLDISQFLLGISGSNTVGLEIVDNNIHDLRGSPINGGNCQDAVIHANHGRDVVLWKGDHADFIHFWTVPGGERLRISILDNLFEQRGGVGVMGIYLDDNGNGVGFDQNTKRNVMISAHGQGMRMERVSGSINDNILIWSGTGREYNDTPRIVITASSGPLEVHRNRSRVSLYMLTDAEIATITLDPIVETTPADAPEAVADWVADWRSDAPTVPPAPTPAPEPEPMPDPRDTKIAELETTVAVLNDRVVELQTQLAALVASAKKSRLEVNAVENGASRALAALDKMIAAAA